MGALQAGAFWSTWGHPGPGVGAESPLPRVGSQQQADGHRPWAARLCRARVTTASLWVGWTWQWGAAGTVSMGVSEGPEAGVWVAGAGGGGQLLEGPGWRHLVSCQGQKPELASRSWGAAGVRGDAHQRPELRDGSGSVAVSDGSWAQGNACAHRPSGVRGLRPSSWPSPVTPAQPGPPKPADH